MTAIWHTIYIVGIVAAFVIGVIFATAMEDDSPTGCVFLSLGVLIVAALVVLGIAGWLL